MSEVAKKLLFGDLLQLDDEGANCLDYWVLTFSPKQKCFHSETLGNMLKENVRQLISNDGECADFMPVGIAERLEDLSIIREKLTGKWEHEVFLFEGDDGKPIKVAIKKGGEVEERPLA